VSKGALIPPSRRGRCAFKQMSRYLEWAQRGEVRILLQQAFDLPGSAESKVA